MSGGERILRQDAGFPTVKSLVTISMEKWSKSGDWLLMSRMQQAQTYSCLMLRLTNSLQSAPMEVLLHL
jgi:hypothetical protein